MNLTTRLFIITAIIVTITDIVEFYYLKRNPEKLTISFVILVIIVTIVPIGINFWFHTRYQ